MTLKKPPENLVIYEVKGCPDLGDKPDFGPDFLGYWIEAGYVFFFFSRESESFMDLSTRHPDLELRYVHRMKYSDWQDGALFQAFRVGPLTIAPAWDEPPRIESGSVIRIDPGLAFGFGGHPTTRACLGILVKIYERYKPRTVLDLGTGTGILALAAATMGAEKICAVEYSHLAADTARENVSLNRLDGLVEVIRGQAEDYARRPAELMLSNLHYQVQEELLRQGGFQDRRWLILSGLFHREAEKMEESLVGQGLKTLDRIRDDRWTTLLLRGDEGGSDN